MVVGHLLWTVIMFQNHRVVQFSCLMDCPPSLFVVMKMFVSVCGC